MKMGLLGKTMDMSIFGFEQEKTGCVVEISVGAIKPNPNQPRKCFDNEALISLSRSISQDGVIQPLTVRDKGGYYELISGERRLRAARIAGLKSVPCIITDISDERSAVYALIENIQRADLNFFEQAQAIQTLIREYSMTQEEAALRLGLSQPAVANKLRLLKLGTDERAAILKGGLTERHARALLRLDSPEKRALVIAKVSAKGLNVSQTESYINAMTGKEKMKESYKKRAPILRDVRLFINTMNKAVRVMQLSGVKANTKKVEREGFVDYIVSIPVGTQKAHSAAS